MQLITAGLILFLSSHLFAQEQASSSFFRPIVPAAIQCDKNKSYLMSEISQIRKTNSLSSLLLRYQPFPKLLIKRSCVDSALQQVSAGRELSDKEKINGGRKKYAANNFIRCDTNKKLLTYQESPCQNQDSITLTHNSFETVTQCLKDYVSDSKDPYIQNEWVKLYFQMLSKESGLQNYVQSSQKALGASQITTHYVRDFIEFSLSDTKEHLKNSNHSVCRRLGEEILSDQALSGFAKKKSNNSYTFNTCSFVGSDNNQILRNFLIGFSNLKIIRDRVRNSAFSNNTAKYSTMDQLKIELSFVPLAYNMGNGNLNKTIERALKYSKQNTNPRLFIEMVRKHIPFEETKNYQSNIDKRFASVVKDSGQKSCFN